MIMRPFSEPEEAALLALLEPAPGAWLDIARPPRCASSRARRWPSTFRRLSELGLCTLATTGPLARARLTSAGRYYAELLHAAQAPVITCEMPPLVLSFDEGQRPG